MQASSIITHIARLGRRVSANLNLNFFLKQKNLNQSGIKVSVLHRDISHIRFVSEKSPTGLGRIPTQARVCIPRYLVKVCSRLFPLSFIVSQILRYYLRPQAVMPSPNIKIMGCMSFISIMLVLLAP